MNEEKKTSKRFLTIVEEIRAIIEDEQIEVGEKLPSERSLSERLQVGRPTIREALRSLELLGLIETRRGEGTFLADFKKHQLVEVLSTFILQHPQSLIDVNETRAIHERAAIEAVCADERVVTLPVWETLYAKVTHESSIWREDVMREIMVQSRNRLSLKIWFLLKRYSGIQYEAMSGAEENEAIRQLLLCIGSQQTQGALEQYERWLTIIEGSGNSDDT